LDCFLVCPFPFGGYIADIGSQIFTGKDTETMISRRGFLNWIGGSAVLAAVISLMPFLKGAVAAGKAKAIKVFSFRKGGYVTMDTVEKTVQEWKEILTPQQFNILRKKGTERAYTGPYWNNKEPGIYTCAGCGLDLFSSEHKYDSGTGWPSFWQPIAPENIGTEDDWSFFVRRTEVHCVRCGGHQGHVFQDGPKPTGLRYCINSYSLKFVASDKK
jgi:peptide-methionine (R)-S-oxide reductase